MNMGRMPGRIAARMLALVVAAGMLAGLVLPQSGVKVYAAEEAGQEEQEIVPEGGLEDETLEEGAPEDEVEEGDLEGEPEDEIAEEFKDEVGDSDASWNDIMLLDDGDQEDDGIVTNDLLVAPQVKMNGKVYDTIVDAINAIPSAAYSWQSRKATIMLGKGTYTLYGADADVDNAMLKFIGSGVDDTIWQIGGVDNSLVDSNDIEFQHMTLQAGSGARGFGGNPYIHVKFAEIDGCISHVGRFAEFKYCAFYAPADNYAIDISTTCSFDGCSFYTSGRAIHVNDSAGGNESVGVYYCYFENDADHVVEQAIVIGNIVNARYEIYIGEYLLEGEYPVDATSCSRVFGFDGGNGNNVTVAYGSRDAFRDGQILLHELMIDHVYGDEEYRIGYSEGYIDDAYIYTIGDWMVVNGQKVRQHSKVCQYCGYSDTTWEKELHTDLLVNGDTETSDVYAVNRGQELTITGVLDVGRLENEVQQAWNTLYSKWGEINYHSYTVHLYNVAFDFTATLEIPDELTFPSDLQVSDIEIDGMDKKVTVPYWDNVTGERLTKDIAVYEIQDMTQDGNKVTVTFGLTQDAVECCEEYKYEFLSQCFNNLGNDDGQIQITIKGIRVDDDAPTNTYMTMVSTVSGSFGAEVAKLRLMSMEEYDDDAYQMRYSWTGLQDPDGRDAIATDEDTIQLTVIIPEDTPEEPEDPEEPDKPHDGGHGGTDPVTPANTPIDTPVISEVVQTNVTVASAPVETAISTTGDDSHMMLYAAMTLMAMGALAVWGVRRIHLTGR